MISKLKHTLFLAFLFINSISMLAQVKTSVNGKVLDEKGAPIFAAIVFLNNNQGSFTEEDGTFEIKEVVPGSYNLTVSFIGYDSQTKFHIIINIM